MAGRKQRSRTELHLLDTQARAGAQAEPAPRRDPADKKHKSMAEVQLTGRQSEQGDRPRQGYPGDRRANQSKK
jgi:hypothetical protein